VISVISVIRRENNRRMAKSAKSAKAIKVEKTEEFIAEYEQEECLWNVCDENYKNRDLKQVAFQRLAEKFEITGNNFEYIFHNKY